MAHPEDFIEVKEAAHLLKKAPSTVYALVDCARLDCARVGCTIHIYRPSILRFLIANPNGRIRP